MKPPISLLARPRALAAQLMLAALMTSAPLLPAQAQDIGEFVTYARLSAYPLDPRETRVTGTAGQNGATIVTRYRNALYVYRYQGPGKEARLLSRSQAMMIPVAQLQGVPDGKVEAGLLGPFPADQSIWIEYKQPGANSDALQAFYLRADGSSMRLDGQAKQLTAYIPAQWDAATREQALNAIRPRLPGSLAALAQDPARIKQVAVATPDAPAELARLHAEVAKVSRKDQPRFKAALADLSALMEQVDIRDIDPKLADPATITRLNDYGFWLVEAQQPAAAVTVLDDVLARAPDRRPVLLNRADAHLQLQQAAATPEQRRYHLVLAQEDYRLYCHRMLSASEKIPSNISQRILGTLKVDQLSGKNCLSHLAIHRAAAQGDAATLQAGLSNGVDPNEADQFGLTPLNHAVRQAQPATTQVLLQAGARVEQQRGGKLLVLALPPSNQAALPQDNYIVARMLLKAGADIEARDNDQSTLLMQRARYSHKDRGTLEFLLQEGADINARNKRGESVLQAALVSPETRWLAEALVKRGANPNTAYISSYYGERAVWLTPLLEALRSYPGDLAPGKQPAVPDKVTFLLEHGADVTLGGLGEPGSKEVPRNGLEAALESAAMYASPDLIATLRQHAREPFSPPGAQPLQKVLSNWNTARLKIVKGESWDAWSPILVQWRATAEAMVQAGVSLRDARTSNASQRGNLPPLALVWLPDDLYAAWLAAGADPAERAGSDLLEDHGLARPDALPIINMAIAGDSNKVEMLLKTLPQMVRTPELCAAAVADVKAWQAARSGPINPLEGNVQRRVLAAASAAGCGSPPGSDAKTK